ncbi:MAG: response regulator [Desulfovibrio sp.]|nr:response regulator [Desulfovibrio sp.]
MPAQPLSVLLLCENEKAGNLDRRALREAGIANVQLMTSGIEAAKLLARPDLAGARYPDIVIALRQLADMDCEQFCAIARQHPGLAGLPILLILASEGEAEEMRALGCQASSLLGRPYSINTLKKHLVPLVRQVPGQRRLRPEIAGMDAEAFEEALATYGVLLRPEKKPEDYFRAGMKSLAEQRWDIAIAAFEQAMRDPETKAEAELGLAAAFKGRGDMQRFRTWLGEASESFVSTRRWNRARSAYARLLQHDPSAKNPFLSYAHKLIRQQEYKAAADALVQSLNLMPKMKAGERYARVCMAAEDPEKMFAALEQSLEEEGDHEFMAGDIRQSMAVMEKQRRERQRQMAEERKWQLAQALARRKRAEETPELAPETPELRQETVIRAWNEEEPEEGGELLAPLGEQEAASELFAKKPRLNEFLSVIKLTWKLAGKSKTARSA